jgi:replication factor A1
MYMPVKVLNSFATDWRIKVRVTKKYAIKSWNNARGSGELMNVDMMDYEGTQIQGTFYN